MAKTLPCMQNSALNDRGLALLFSVTGLAQNGLRIALRDSEEKIGVLPDPKLGETPPGKSCEHPIVGAQAPWLYSR
jgi:hypothetical protein